MAQHVGGAPVDVVPPVVMDSTAIAGMSHMEQCRNGDESPETVGLLLTDKDMSTAEPEAIVVGAIGTGTPWFLTGWRNNDNNSAGTIKLCGQEADPAKQCRLIDTALS